jgi:predicted nucleotidyltransferase
LVEEFDLEEIILFGSRAWGQPRPDSDYDLFVVVSESEAPPLQRAVKAHECLSELGISKDVLISTREQFDRVSRVPASLEAKIRDRGVVLYGHGHTGIGPRMATGRSDPEAVDAPRVRETRALQETAHGHRRRNSGDSV